jgi:hypothetical protein
MLVFAVFLVVGGALVYLPELVNVTAASKRKNETAAPKSGQAIVLPKPGTGPASEATKGPVRQTPKDPLKRVLQKFDDGFYDTEGAGVDAATVPQLDDEESGGFFSRLFSLKPRNKKLKALRGDKVAQRAALMQALKKGKPTWDLLHMPVVSTTLQRASMEAETLYKILPPAKIRSRIALRNFVAGLEYFGGRDINRKMTAEEGIKYLESIDRQVTDALIMDRVDRDQFTIWRNVSIETLLKQSGGNAYKSGLLPEFVADITVCEVTLKAVDDTKSNFVRTRGPLFDLSVMGYVNSSAATTIELFGPGQLHKTAKLGQQRDSSRREFRFSTTRSPSGRFVIRVSDAEGGHFSKTYSFIGKARRYRNLQTGDYEIPKVNTSEPDRPLDRSLDRVFAITSMGSSPVVDSRLASGDYVDAFAGSAAADPF